MTFHTLAEQLVRKGYTAEQAVELVKRTYTRDAKGQFSGSGALSRTIIFRPMDQTPNRVSQMQRVSGRAAAKSEQMHALSRANDHHQQAGRYYSDASVSYHDAAKAMRAAAHHHEKFQAAVSYERRSHHGLYMRDALHAAHDAFKQARRHQRNAEFYLTNYPTNHKKGR